MHYSKRCYLINFLFVLVHFAAGSLWDKLKDSNDLTEFRRMASEHKVVQYWLEDSDTRMTVFAPVDDVFLRYPELRSMQAKEMLGHFVDVRVPEISTSGRWANGSVLVKKALQGGRVFVEQFENNPGNFSYFANNGRMCNHVSTSWFMVSGNQMLYKLCSWYGHTPYVGSAIDFIKDSPTAFQDFLYSNQDLSRLRDQIHFFPTIATIIFGTSAWNAFHTFFLPSNEAFNKVPNARDISQEVLLAHVTMPNVCLFTEAWLYDYGVHWYSTIRLDSNAMLENYKLKVAIRNITNRETGRWSLYAVSQVYEKYSTFRRGAVWALIQTPNIPVSNGAVHIIDTVLGVITNTIEQLLDNDGEKRFTTLMLYIREVGQQVLSFLSANQGLITFFAPTNEAFKRIPRDVENRLLRDRIWMNQVLRMHIVPGKELTTDEINNQTIVNTVEKWQQLFFIKGEWPQNNITYYVVGGGVRATIRQEDVAATNGIVQYIDRVLGVPYYTMFEIIQNETSLYTSYQGIRETNLRFTLDPWEVVRPEQNFTFFVPTNEAWDKVPRNLRKAFYDGSHWNALGFVFKRLMIQGQALQLPDFREYSFVMMNNQRVVTRKRGRWWELYWPYGNQVARLIEGGQLAARNGFMHKIDNVFVLEEDLKATATHNLPSLALVLFGLVLGVSSQWVYRLPRI